MYKFCIGVKLCRMDVPLVFCFLCGCCTILSPFHWRVCLCNIIDGGPIARWTRLEGAKVGSDGLGRVGGTEHKLHAYGK